MAIKKGFTLAEVMVTLGLLGVLAAVLVPAVTKVTPNSSKVMFKKTYYTLEKVIGSMINDEANYPSSQVDPLAALPQGFNYTNPTTNGTANKFCYFLGQNLNTLAPATCPLVSDTPGLGTFTTTDGATWAVYLPISDQTTTANYNLAANQNAASQFPLAANLYTTVITVDVNGSKAPNCGHDAFSTTYLPTAVSACSGANLGKPDTFQIGIRYDGKLRIQDSDGTEDTDATTILSAPTNNQ